MPMHWRLAATLAAVIGLLAEGARGDASCNNTFCNNRGVAAVSSTTFVCQCACTTPYYGYRCVRSAVVDSLPTNATYGCSSSPVLGDQLSCNTEPRCYWDGNFSVCRSRSVTSYNVSTGATESVPWCYKLFQLPFIMSVYAVATVAFGFCFVGAVYLGYYHNVHSVLEPSGQRVFNSYYYKSSPIISYCLAVFFSSGLLAVTAYINLNVQSNCTYVYFVYIYLVVQLAPLVAVPLYYLVLYLIHQAGKNLEATFELNNHVLPDTATALLNPLMSSQVRCF